MKQIECKFCGKLHDPQQVKRSLGEYSMPYALGYCSAQCYTKAITLKKEPKHETLTKDDITFIQDALTERYSKYYRKFKNSKLDDVRRPIYESIKNKTNKLWDKLDKLATSLEG